MDYRKINDYELLNLIYENNEEAKEILFGKYKPLIDKKAREFLKIIDSNGLELSDLIQEGMIGLNEAVSAFNNNKNVQFFTFATLCIERQMKSLLIGTTREKHKILNESLSLDYIDEENCKTMLDFISENQDNPESKILLTEQEEYLMLQIEGVLTNFEYQVFWLKINNFTYREIANILDKDLKSIDNAICRVKAKVKEILDKESIMI